MIRKSIVGRPSSGCRFYLRSGEEIGKNAKTCFLEALAFQGSRPVGDALQTSPFLGFTPAGWQK